ncbi:MAG TPA: hypothetical protein VE842_00105, partial [Pyrinomonadaceae bacterium]|nr:hypothetical protein [Pyrinomonadaceae bacterium]
MTEEDAASTDAPVILLARPPMAIIRLNRPAKRNPLSVSTLNQLDSITSALLERTDIKAIIFTGTGDVFA